ncbi:MAG: DUF805 domain-containing protein [Deltaproteobacteria bacterium]|jgi:uncharacterized membrane protein YhaH (DUF805 family)|nr:DUF805 domain-containing protein [Deltaproteobacteria bacterium]
MNYVIHALRNPFTYTGRASRAEFWLSVLFSALVVAGLVLIGLVSSLISATLLAVFLGLAGLAGLASVPILVAVSVRRVHDFGQGGWLVVLMLIVPLVFVICGIVDGQWLTNRYGPRPPALDF